MGILFIFLCTVLQFHIVRGANNCTGFQLYDLDTQVTNFTCTSLKLSDCQAGPESLPNNLSDGDSVAKPRDFEAREFRRNFTYQGHVLQLSGINFTWKPPLDRISRSHLKGFYMRRLQVNSATRTCTLVDLQQLNLTSSTNFRFSFELYPIFKTEFTSFWAYLTSLPPPSDSEFESGLVEQAFYTVQPGLNYSDTPVQYPAYWTTWINVKLHETKSIVEVIFGYPTSDSLAKFTSFDLQLVAPNNSNPFQRQEVNKLGTDSEGRYNFTNIPSGSYKVQVQPKDPYFTDDDKCMCWEIKPSSMNLKWCTPCRFSTTGYFNFTSPTTTTTTTTTTPKVGASTDDGGSVVSNGDIAAIVVVPVVAMVLVIVVLICLQRKGKLSLCLGGRGDINENFHPKDKPDWRADVNIVDITGQEKELQTPQLKQKKILLLAAEDHLYFIQAVEKMATFLQLHCQCDVTFAPQQMAQLRKANNSYCWLSRQIDSADFVVIVTSEAAYRLYLAYRKGQVYREGAWGPEGDLFTPGVQHICGKIANSQDVRNVVMVCLPHTSSSFRLPIDPLPSFYFRLPAHLSTFLHHIHALDKNTMDLSKVNLPLQGNLEILKGGGEWLEAIRKAEEFEQNNPSWFDHKFGTPVKHSCPKPDLTHQVSHDSGFNDSRNSQELKHNHRLSSASDIPMDEDENYHNFTKEDFIAPSMVFSAYTVEPARGNRLSENDQHSLSDEFHRQNWKYEQEQNDGPLFNGLPYDPHAMEVVYPSSQVMRGFNLEVDDHDCVSVSSAQSV